MMATRKVLSALIVLTLISSGISLTAFAAPLPSSENEDAPPEDDVIVIPEPSEEAIALSEELSFEPVRPAEEDVPLDRAEALNEGVALADNLPERLPIAGDGGRFYRGDYDHRGPGDVLLIDDDDSTVVGTTQQFNNSGLYDMDVGKIMHDALNDASVAHDVYVVDYAQNGPDFQMMTNYTTLIWCFGYEWSIPTLTNADINRVIAFMESGGSVWFIGNAFIGEIYGFVNRTVGGQVEFSEDGFAMKYLGIEEYIVASGLPNPVNTTDTTVMDGDEVYSTRPYFDQFGSVPAAECAITRPKTGAHGILEGDSISYFNDPFDDEPNTVAYDSGTWRVVTSSLDVANIRDATDREDLVKKVTTWLDQGVALRLPTHSMYNWYIEYEDHNPVWTYIFNALSWGGIYNFIGGTFHTHKKFTAISHFENHGSSNERNVVVRFVIRDVGGNELVNTTKIGSADSRKLGQVSIDFTPTRSGFYFVFTNISIANDYEMNNNDMGNMIRVAEWLDDLENDTKEDWTYEGRWQLIDDADQSWSATHAWRISGTQQIPGHELVTPPIDVRFYNTTSTVPTPLSDVGWNNAIFFNFFFQGRLYGAGGDSIELFMKASNMTTWRSMIKYDGNTQVTGQVNGDFSNGWYRYTYGLYMGDFAGQTFQFKWKFVKTAITNSWWAIDDGMCWMQDERNVGPWLTVNPEDQVVEMDVGTQMEFSVFAQDPTDDEPITYKWFENYQVRSDWTSNKTILDIPRTVPAGHMYERGKSLNIAIRVFDDLTYNDTFWTVRLMDPKPVKGPEFVDLIEVNEDEPKDVDFGTSSNIKWFQDIESQTFTVTSVGTPNIMVSEKGNNVLEIKNKNDDWNGVDNITLKVTDSAGSMANFTVMVRVYPVNDPPRWKPVILPDGEQDMFYSYNLTATDVDNLVADLTYSDTAEFFEISASGEIAFVPRNDHVGKNVFNVTVMDPDGLSDVMELELLIANINDPPILRFIPRQWADEDTIFNLDVSQYVEDPDLLLPPEYRDRITYRDDTPKLDTNLETGIVTWDVPTNEDVGDFYFKITIQDSKGRYAEQEVRITVNNTPDAPEIKAISKQVLHEDALYTLSIPYDDEDMDIPGVNEELTFTNDNQQLFIIDAATGRIQFTPTNAHVGVWQVTITVTDSFGLDDSQMVLFEVLNENDAPTLEYIRVQELTEDVPFELQVEATDPDLELRLVDNLPVDPDEELTFKTNSSRVLIDEETGLISFTPNNDDALRGSIMVKITVRDAALADYTIDVLFNIQGVNDAPDHLGVSLGIVPLIDNQTFRTDKKYQLVGKAEDVDNSPEELTYNWYLGTTLIGQTQTITWKPKGSGLKELHLVVTDPDGAETEHKVNIKIKKIDDGPGFGSVMGILAMALIGMMAITSRRWRMR